MRTHKNALLCLVALTSLTLMSDGVFAQRVKAPGVASTPMRGGGGGGGGSGGSGGGNFGGGFGGAIPGVIMAIPSMIPRGGGQYIDDGVYDRPQGQNRPPQRSARRGGSGVPPAGERRMVPDEVVIELANTMTPQAIDALQRRSRLVRLDRQTSQLTGTTFYRWRIPDRRSVAAVVRALETDSVVASAQPNYLSTLQQAAPAAGDPAQYELAKLHLPEAHALAKGDGVLVAVIDSAIDLSHPDLEGSIVRSFDTVNPNAAAPPHKHGTGIAGLIAAHGKLTGSAPGARLLAIRAFDPAGSTAAGSTFNIFRAIDWAVANHARVINMSFAGPADPAVHRALEAAYKKGVVLIAAAGNAGPKSPPLFPAADPNVIAVTGTTIDNTPYAQANRGPYIAIAAPGVDILVAIPDGGYEISSGTSLSAAEISGVVALMLERKPELTPGKVREILMATAKDLGAKGPDVIFGAGLADAYAAIMADAVPVAAAQPRPVERVSTEAR